MDDTPKKPGFGSLQLPAIDAKLKPGAAPKVLGPLDELVLFSVRLTREDILHLNEALHWVPGFKIQDFVQQAVREKLVTLGDQVKPLPPLVLQELVKRNKKMQKG
jgi:hypothetical protein